MECSWVGRLEGNLRSYAVCFGSFELGASRFVEGRSAAEEVKNEAEVVGEDGNSLQEDKVENTDSQKDAWADDTPFEDMAAEPRVEKQDGTTWTSAGASVSAKAMSAIQPCDHTDFKRQGVGLDQSYA